MIIILLITYLQNGLLSLQTDGVGLRVFCFTIDPYLSERLLRPRFFAKIFAVHLLVGHVNPVRQCGYQREYPYGGNYLRRRQYSHSRLERVDDDKETVYGDRSQRQRGRVNASALGVRHNMAEYLAKHPMAWKHKNN